MAICTLCTPYRGLERMVFRYYFVITCDRTHVSSSVLPFGVVHASHPVFVVTDYLSNGILGWNFDQHMHLVC
jgi:hypothetical protein